MARRSRAKSFLLGLGKLAVLLVLAGGVGAAVGFGLTSVSDSDGPAASQEAPTSTAEATAAAPAASQEAPASAPKTTEAAPRTATTPADPLKLVSVRVPAARLHPAGTPSGERRQRSRLTVRVRAQNRGTATVTLPRPELVVGDVRVRTDPRADTPRTHLAALGPGETQAVTLRFELAGEATAQVIDERRARIVMAGKTVPIDVGIGAPVKPPG